MILTNLFCLISTYWHLILFFFVVAVLYSSVGFGGGSSYLAILALTGIAFTQIRTTALLCNVVVVSGNVFLYYKTKSLHWKKIIPLVVCSVPLAFVGGKLKISEHLFFILLGCTLLFASVTMYISKKTNASGNNPASLHLKRNVSFGSIIGFVSGMVGIGGGIFLAPLLHLTNWDTPKKIAATASFFILVNSIAGLLGQYANEDFYINRSLTGILLLVVFIGGQIGVRVSNTYFTSIQLKKATAILIAFVGLRILWKYLF